MSNVLPRGAQNNNWKLHRAHFLGTTSVVLIVLSIVAALALLPAYLTLYAGGDTTAGADGVKDIERTSLINAQALLTLVAPLTLSTTTPTQAIAAALADRPKGVFVDHVNYTKGSPSMLMLVGSASGRTTINAYRQALTDDPHFTSVTLPVGDLLGTEGGKFSITLSGQF